MNACGRGGCGGRLMLFHRCTAGADDFLCPDFTGAIRSEQAVEESGLHPLISVVLPVYNGTATLDRALRSLKAQLFSGWELVAVDDGSTDATHEVLQGWAAGDARIRVVRLEENRGPAAARNAGLQIARGRWIAYLDHDDDYCPDYLEQVARHRDETAAVLVFGYDIVRPDGQSSVWEPGTSCHELFSTHVAMPMALAHRRQLIEQAGGFNELLWWRRTPNSCGDCSGLEWRSASCPTSAADTTSGPTAAAAPRGSRPARRRSWRRIGGQGNRSTATGRGARRSRMRMCRGFPRRPAGRSARSLSFRRARSSTIPAGRRWRPPARAPLPAAERF